MLSLSVLVIVLVLSFVLALAFVLVRAILGLLIGLVPVIVPDLVELEVVLPRDTLLYESHDLGMELQYEIESREEVERCFVHIDYESRPYDEHVVSKVPELRERYGRKNSATSI